MAGRSPLHPSGRDPEPFLLSIALKPDEPKDPNAFPFVLGAFRGFTRLAFDRHVTFLVGENGSGKSTLLEAIAVAAGFNAEGGSNNFRFETRSSHSNLHAALRLARGARRPRTGYFLRAESFFNVATEIERLDEGEMGPKITPSYGGRSLHEQSHGESFMALAQSRFGRDGLYFLDEPEAALSPSRQLAFLARMHELLRLGSQFIVATHSPIVMAYPNATIYLLDADGLRKTEYERTEHYSLTRDFLMNRARYIDAILDPKEDEEPDADH